MIYVFVDPCERPTLLDIDAHMVFREQDNGGDDMAHGAVISLTCSGEIKTAECSLGGWIPRVPTCAG
jgi:hypothetical protein